MCFHRQVPLPGRFIADSSRPPRGSWVEVDGEYHARRKRADGARMARARIGYRVVRVDAELMLRDVEATVALTRAAP